MDYVPMTDKIRKEIEKELKEQEQKRKIAVALSNYFSKLVR